MSHSKAPALSQPTCFAALSAMAIVATSAVFGDNFTTLSLGIRSSMNPSINWYFTRQTPVVGSKLNSFAMLLDCENIEQQLLGLNHSFDK